ncbi:MAG: hypothetical protein GWN99_05150 [Gemmatimonadetes bacterium]|uniref:Uncharacterized protein n=1 Tax=Candidatus Kutchimonas denitrificans TaxID=3056748 RepID=A0AAE4ZBB8_9BACT|nr:hypothetical protein [Gemmatimonadota bacterium]NIR76072.1 hypothetical protein [Candidatus Kutchimonas denitrificans]NIS00451.1 hypothetical protein [Gemmatimonadota bacterium]NIT66109.1 hypothetical protein [Gemmatimonadota bacterium]NIU54187.1 hypothetical protein [Gemmatimonadota bacterium]
MSIRSAIDQILIVAGVVVIVTPVAIIEEESWTPLIIVLFGILLVGLGVYSIGHRLLPDRRVYIGLRAEVEYFIQLVRRVNTHALRNEADAIELLRTEMKESVDRMISLAGKPGELGR